MVLINGQLVPAMSMTINSSSVALQGEKQTAGRSALLSQLRGQVMQKTSKNIDIAHIQSTFKTQDLSKKKQEVTVEDALAHDLEKGAAASDDADLFPEDNDDESFKADVLGEKNDEEVANHNWDDEENIKSVLEDDLEDCIQSSADAVSHSGASAGKATPASVASRSEPSSRQRAVKSANESMEEAEIVEALKSNESSLGAAELLQRKEVEAQK